MYCTRCGRQLGEGDRFCSGCGEPTSQARTEGAVSGRRLMRSMRDKKIAGVCAGFADYLEVDVTLMRIVWLCAALFTGVGFIAYLICWIVMPKDYSPAPAAVPETQPPPEQAPGNPTPGAEPEAGSGQHPA